MAKSRIVQNNMYMYMKLESEAWEHYIPSECIFFCDKSLRKNYILLLLNVHLYSYPLKKISYLNYKLHVVLKQSHFDYILIIFLTYSKQNALLFVWFK